MNCNLHFSRWKLRVEKSNEENEFLIPVGCHGNFLPSSLKFQHNLCVEKVMNVNSNLICLYYMEMKHQKNFNPSQLKIEISSSNLVIN